MEQLFSSAHLDILFQADTHILFCHWKGVQTSQGIRDAGAVILSIVRDRGISKVLNDNRYVIGSWYDVSDWTATQWFPAMTEAGLKAFAWIQSENVFAAMSAKRAMPVELDSIRVFYEYEEAQKWLIEMT